MQTARGIIRFKIINVVQSKYFQRFINFFYGKKSIPFVSQPKENFHCPKLVQKSPKANFYGPFANKRFHPAVSPGNCVSGYRPGRKTPKKPGSLWLCNGG